MKMRVRATLLFAFVVTAGALIGMAQTPLDLSSEWTEKHITRMDPSQVRHEDVKEYLAALREYGLSINEVGKSLGGREIFQMSFGRGPLKILLWSQMHGDEPTATSALVDLFAFLHVNRKRPWIAALEEAVSLHAIPMLNPDGAELFQRRNLQAIDINRDARLLSTPEGRLLKRLRDEWSPHLGFNLHNQNMRTSVGDTGRQATISLLAVPFDSYGNDNDGRILAKRVCAIICEALSPFIYGQIARYDDSFNPRAFGDAISQAGTPVILIETGGWHGHSELDLVKLNFVALAMTLKSLIDGSIARANPAVYDALRYNSTGDIYDLILRNGTLVSRGAKGTSGPLTFRGDIGINFERSGLGGKIEPRGQIADVGDLSIFSGLETVDASGYFVTAAGGPIRGGTDAVLLFYRQESAGKIDWAAEDLESRFPPDAIFRHGQWSGKANPPRQ
ncbi:MAG: M14 family zinc carboxypeptidase [Acidobacteriota bacterium]